MYVPRSRRTTSYKYVPSRARGKLQTSKKRKTTYGKKASYPTRLTGSRINYVVAKQVNRAMSRVSENKINPFTKINELNPTPIQLGAVAHTLQFMIGDIPSIWTGTRGLNTITPFAFPQGDGQSNRDGDSIYLNKSVYTMELDMNQLLPGRQVTQFRVVCFKALRADTPQGIAHAYKDNLFLDTNGSYFGHETPGINGTDLMVQPINKKYWNVLHDQSFTMSPVSDNATTYNSSYYGSHRTMRFNIPWYKKVSFENPSFPDTPDNIDFRWVCAIFARPVGKDGNADSWEANIRGLTTFKDN